MNIIDLYYNGAICHSYSSSNDSKYVKLTKISTSEIKGPFSTFVIQNLNKHYYLRIKGKRDPLLYSHIYNVFKKTWQETSCFPVTNSHYFDNIFDCLDVVKNSFNMKF